MSVVPTMLKALLASTPWQDYHPAFRFFLLGGGPIDRPTLTVCQQRHLPVIQSYGMTETASQVVALNFADAPHKIHGFLAVSLKHTVFSFALGLGTV